MRHNIGEIFNLKGTPMRRYLAMLFVFLLWAFAFPAIAAVLHPAVQLESLVQLKPQEKSGDEIYIHVIELAPTAKITKTYNVPPHPLYWRFFKKSTIKKVWLWQGKLEEGQSINIQFTVMEKEFHAATPDDFIGGMTLKLKNNHGVLQTQWVNGQSTKSEVVKSLNNKAIVNGMGQRFHMNGSGGIYEMILRPKLN